MREEFFFKFQNGKHLMNLREFDRVMDGRMTSMVQDRFNDLDKRMVEVLYQRQKQAQIVPPKKSLGIFPASLAIRKFR